VAGPSQPLFLAIRGDTEKHYSIISYAYTRSLLHNITYRDGYVRYLARGGVADIRHHRCVIIYTRTVCDRGGLLLGYVEVAQR
jgi:hypothetical protein